MGTRQQLFFCPAFVTLKVACVSVESSKKKKASQTFLPKKINCGNDTLAVPTGAELCDEADCLIGSDVSVTMPVVLQVY